MILWSVVALAGAWVLLREIRARRREQMLNSLLAMFGPVVSRVQVEPSELVAWHSIASTSRALFPDLFRELDFASGHRFPFSRELIEGTHARWTTRWLAWECRHDLEYKQRTSEVEAMLAGALSHDEANLKAQLTAIEQEKLQRYQERYEEYVRVGKAIAELE